ncbi:YSIRK-type signal peptide-containing protein [Streptococcus suis]|nr:YSIRK-type signal peptide-containing protein [Streptococcus suis]
MWLDFIKKKLHFGIRKFSIGVVSVALAISFSFTGGQVVAAKETSQANVSSLATSQTSPEVIEEATQVQSVSGQTEVVEEAASSQSATTSPQVTPSHSGLVETEPVVQDSATNQELAVSQTVALSQAEPVQNQTVGEEQSGQVAGELSLSIEPTESTSSATGDADMDLSQVEQPVVASPDQVSQLVQPSETLVEEATPTNQVVEEAVQPVLRSARMARSVAAQELAKLPLDANGKLVTSLTNQSAVKLQTVFADGTSQIEEANAANLPRIKNGQNVSELVGAVSPELKAVDYESLYERLNHSERLLEKILLEQALKKENGGKALTDEEMSQRKRQVYMNQLDMRDSFNSVQTNLDSILAGIFEKTTTVDANTIKANKEKILLGLTYLDRQYGFQFGNFSAKDLILYHPEVFGNSSEPLTNLLAIGDLAYADLELRNNLVTYQRKLSSITNHADVIQFIESQVPRWTGQGDVSAWFKDTSKAYIVEASSPHGQTKLYTTLRDSQRWQNHILPLLNLSDDSLYAISTTNTITYGAVDTYLAEKNDSTRAALKTTIADYATHQQAFLDFWYRISEQSERLKTYEPIIVTDSLQAYSTGKASAEQLWSPKSGPKALTGVQEFIGPMNLYINFVRAGGQANGTNSMNNFLYKSLTNDGHAVYTHELTHMLDKTVWLNGHGRRPDQLQEVFARGLFESLNMSASPTSDPIFNLNTAYTISGDRTQNGHPSRFQTSTDLKTYMQGMLDVLYTLDYAEAQSILKHTAADRAVLLNKISLIPNPANNGGGKTTEIVNSIDTTSAANLQTIADFVDQGLISGRYKFNGMETRGTARTNSYYTIPLFEPIYAALQNDTGSGGDISFKRNAYEILGEYGYEKGMVAYLSDQYANDKEALAAIMPEYNGNLASFKKAMFDRRIAKVSELKPTSVASDFTAIQTKMDEAIAKDLERLKSNAANKVPLSTRVSAVQDLKKSIFQAYLKDTNEFRTSIYQEQVARDLYVTNGDEKSQDGHGTLDNPYQSLSFALAQAKNGDRIKLVDNVMHRQDKPFLLDKAVTIDGQGHRLSFRGPDVELGADVTFADVTLNMLADGSKQSNIYANGYHLTLDQVSTTMSQAQSDLRPTLVAGSRSGQPAGSHGKITILNGNSDTRFNTIYAGNADSVSNIPVTISILSDFVSVDQGIKLSGVNGEVVMEPVLVTSKSSSLKSIDGNGSWDNTVTIDTARIYGLNLQNIQTLELVNQADVSLASQVSEISTGVELESGTQLTIANDPVTLGSLSGQGTVVIPVESSLNVIGDIEGNVEVLVRGFEQDLAKNIDKEYVRVEGMLSPTARITLEKGYNRFDLVKDEIVYRLVELRQPVQTHTVTLHFTQSGQLLKEKQVQVDNGQSITGVENDLPIATEGTYQLDPNFDRTVLTAITSSKTIEIPVVLVLPKASRYQPHVNGEARVLPASSSEETKAEIVKQISLPVDAGQFDVVVVTPIPQSSGDHSMTVRVIYDDRSQEELVVPLHILTIKNGEVVKHSLPAGVLPKADRYQPHVNGEARVLPASSSEETKAEIVKQISLPADAGQFDVVVVTPIPQSSGDHSMTVRVVYDDRSEEELVVPLHILTIKNGEVVKHSLPEGVLEPLVTAKGKGVTHELPVGILPPLETANGGGVRHELPAGVLEPLVTAKGKGVTHELPAGILPPLETANGGGVRHELPAGVLEPLVTAKGKGVTHELPIGILPPLETANGGGVRHELPAGVLEPLVTAKGKGVTHELPVGILPPLETANGGGVRHELPEGVLEPLVTAKGKGVTHFIPSGTLPLTVTRSEAYTPAMPAVSLLQQRQKNTETKPAVLSLVAVPQKQADQLSANLTSSNSATSTSNRLPETGERNNLSLLGFLLASLGFSFWIGRKKVE